MVGSFFEQTVADVYRSYERELHRMNAMDFDDLLVRAVNVLELFPEVRERYANGFRHVLVDEYQDTNHAQYRWLQLLAGEHRNLMVVGDDAQCLVEGTLVTMADGSRRPIETIAEGDRVLWAYGERSIPGRRGAGDPSVAAIRRSRHHDALRPTSGEHPGAHPLRRVTWARKRNMTCAVLGQVLPAARGLAVRWPTRPHADAPGRHVRYRHPWTRDPDPAGAFSPPGWGGLALRRGERSHGDDRARRRPALT